jgi:hypothetical protein
MSQQLADVELEPGRRPKVRVNIPTWLLAVVTLAALPWGAAGVAVLYAALTFAHAVQASGVGR